MSTIHEINEGWQEFALQPNWAQLHKAQSEYDELRARVVALEVENAELKSKLTEKASLLRGCYAADHKQKQRIEELIAERDALKAERDELRATEAAWRKLNDTLLHQVLCCGVAASHPDATLTTRGAYAGKWNSKQAEAVRALRADRDSLRAELERIKALEPVMVYHSACTIDCGEHGHHHTEMLKMIPAGTKLYALGSKTA